MRLGNRTLEEVVSRELPVCGAGAFVVLKALAFRNRYRAGDDAFCADVDGLVSRPLRSLQ